MKNGANFQGIKSRRFFFVNKFFEILKYLRLVILKFLGQGKYKTSTFLHCQTKHIFDRNHFQRLWIRLQTFLNVYNIQIMMQPLKSFLNFITLEPLVGF